MKYTGGFSNVQAYEVGDIAVYTDGVPYWLRVPAGVGTECYDSRYWQRVSSPMAEVIIALHPFLQALGLASVEAAATTATVNAMLFDPKTLVLASSTASSEKTFAITVDDDGDLDATEITAEEEVAEGGES